MNKKFMLYGIVAAMMATAAPLAAQADEWHGGHPDAWYFHPRWVGRRYVVAPVPAPVTVVSPYYYQPPVPVYYPPAPMVVEQPGISLSVVR